MSSFLKDGWKPSYWKEVFTVKIPRHWKRMKARLHKGKSLPKVAEMEVEEELKEGPSEWG